MADNRIELSRGVGTAPSYGKSNRSAGVGQAKTVIVAIALEATLARDTGLHRSQTMFPGLARGRFAAVRLAVV